MAVDIAEEALTNPGTEAFDRYEVIVVDVGGAGLVAHGILVGNTIDRNLVQAVAMVIVEVEINQIFYRAALYSRYRQYARGDYGDVHYKKR